MSREILQFENLIRELQERVLWQNKNAREAKKIKDEAEELKKNLKISLKN